MSVRLVPINRSNWEDCINLKVSEEQAHFVASNLYSIAEFQFLPNFEAMGIYVEDEMVGFTMFGLDEDDLNYWIYRLMIDAEKQGEGYGHQALTKIIQYLKETKDCPLIMVGYHKENEAVHSLYKKAGFVSKGVAPWGELLAAYIY